MEASQMANKAKRNRFILVLSQLSSDQPVYFPTSFAKAVSRIYKPSISEATKAAAEHTSKDSPCNGSRDRDAAQ
jgi:hypothetical protein